MKVVQPKHEGVEELDLTNIDGEELKMSQSSNISPSKETSIKLINAASSKSDQHEAAQAETTKARQD